MRKEMGDSYTNFSLLLGKHLEKCADLMLREEVATRLGINPWDESTVATPSPPTRVAFNVPVDPGTREMAKRNGFALKVFRVQVADGRLLAITDVKEARAQSYGEAWAKAHPDLRACSSGCIGLGP